MDWFLYDNGVRHEKGNRFIILLIVCIATVQDFRAFLGRNVETKNPLSMSKDSLNVFGLLIRKKYLIFQVGYLLCPFTNRTTDRSENITAFQS